MDLSEERLPKLDQLIGRRFVEEPEEREGRGEIVDHGATAEQGRPLGGHGHGTSNRIFVMHPTEMESIVEQLHQRERIALVGALRAQASAGGLGAIDVAGSVSNPGLGATGRRGVRSHLFGWIRWHIVRSSHARRLASRT